MRQKRLWKCDRCGFEMVERHCKVLCSNCGARWDCSDVTIWVGDGRQIGEQEEQTSPASQRT